jgi:hypothetical protein
MRLFSTSSYYLLICSIGLVSLAFVGCARVAVTPETIRPPDPSLAYNAIQAEPTFPAQVLVRDFDFAPSSVTENRSVVHRATDLVRSSSPEERRIAIGRDVAASLSEATAKRLRKTGLAVARIGDDEPLPSRGNFLLVTGRLIDVDEGDRLQRVALGFGAGESRLAAQVHVFRVVDGEKAEVLAFTTYADSGKMPGMAPSMAAGVFLMGPITAVTVIEDVVSSGQKIYSSQVESLAGQTGDQVSRYLSQYAAAEHWIPRNKAKSVNLAG